MTRLTPIHGTKLIKILCNQFGFRVVRQRGSHVTLEKNRTYVTVPAKQIGIGLLDKILKDCSVSREEFLQYT